MGMAQAMWQRSHPYQHQLVPALQSFALSLFVMLKINERLTVRSGVEPWGSAGCVWPRHLPAKRFSPTTTETDFPSHLSSPQLPSRTRSAQLSFHPRADYRRGASLHRPPTHLFRRRHKKDVSGFIIRVISPSDVYLGNTLLPHQTLHTSTCYWESSPKPWGRAAASPV